MPIHPMAVVDPLARIHPDAVVGPFCYIQGPVTIAAGAELRNGASVYGRTSIGAGTILFSGCVIGSDPQDLKYRGEDSETIIGERCRIHEFVTVSKGTAGGGMKTVIGNDVLVMAYAHIAHDCHVADHVVIANNSQLAGHVKIGRKAIISGMVAVHHFVTIGELAFVGGMSGVRFDIPPYLIAEGNPAEPRNVNLVGLRRDGVDEAAIARMRELFRALYHDRGATPISEALAAVAAGLTPEDADRPAGRLVAWLTAQLNTSVQGRMQEATRPPAIGKKPARRDGANGAEGAQALAS